MVAYNFSPRFAALVKSGKKRQTIRRTLRIAPGDAIQAYIGQRTKNCQKLLTKDPICKAVHGVKLCPTGVFLDGEPLTLHDAQAFAHRDGFIDLQEMLDWFFGKYEITEFHGFVITW